MLGRRLVAGHRSAEPGHRIVLESSGLEPLLDLDLRLGEASGAAIAIGIVEAAVRLQAGMATFEEAAVSEGRGRSTVVIGSLAGAGTHRPRRWRRCDHENARFLATRRPPA